MKQTICKLSYQSPIGKLDLIADDKYIYGIFFSGTDAALKNLGIKKSEIEVKMNSLLKKAVGQLNEYFKGQRQKFDLPLKLAGTDFQIQVWKSLNRIPYGNTVSYSQQCRLMGRENASRAVGSANGKNNFPIVIPCHRVIRSDGSLGGYSGGLGIKKKLLDLELEFK